MITKGEHVAKGKDKTLFFHIVIHVITNVCSRFFAKKKIMPLSEEFNADPQKF